MALTSFVGPLLTVQMKRISEHMSHRNANVLDVKDTVLRGRCCNMFDFDSPEIPSLNWELSERFSLAPIRMTDC